MHMMTKIQIKISVRVLTPSSREKELDHGGLIRRRCYSSGAMETEKDRLNRDVSDSRNRLRTGN